MRKKYLFLLITFFSFSFNGIFAQSLEEAKKLFQNKEYEKAKPAFQRLVKSAPNNASYNYWYGACCYETGEKELSEKYLLIGAKRKVQEAFRYLGQLYFDQYRFEESEEYYEEYITILQKAKKPVKEFEQRVKQSKLGARMLKGVEEVTFIDSVVIDKNIFLEAYKISEESGKIDMFNSFFNKTNEEDATVYQTELKNKLFYAETYELDNLDLYTRNRQQNEWGIPTRLPDNINTGYNENYPYVLSDGITIYYASNNDNNSLGGYDIFVTRYNTNTDSYMMPDNIGMPFNSPFNDYMFVIDEFNNLGWFASDRYQEANKVCIYVFIPNLSKQTFNYEITDKNVIRNAARINSIEESWKNSTEIKVAKQRLAVAKYHQPKEKQNYDFLFIIDDNTTYYFMDDFTSIKAKSQFNEWQQKQKDYEKIVNQLESQREKFKKSKPNERKSMTPGILDLEKRVEQMETEIKRMEVNIRNEENKNLHK